MKKKRGVTCHSSSSSSLLVTRHTRPFPKKNPDTAQSLMLQNSLKPTSGYNIYLERTESVPLGKKWYLRVVWCGASRLQGCCSLPSLASLSACSNCMQLCIAPDADALRMFRQEF